MRKLQILIPQYKETEEIIKPLLNSIKVQQNVDGFMSWLHLLWIVPLSASYRLYLNLIIF